MSQVTIAGVQAYTIPFDSIDTKYLGEYVARTAETVPIWTRKRLDGEAEYCHVQLIVAQNDENCFSEPADTYVCHICNVHVPKICSKEHNASDQHGTIKKIHQKVLEKVSKHIDTNIENSNQKINTDEYYCVPCSKIIKKENKEKHESTEYHAKSKKDSIIINEFYKIIKEDKIDHENILINENNTEDVDKNKYFKTNNDDVTVCKNINNHLENDRPTTENVAVQGPSKINKPSKEDNANSFEVYTRAMLKKYNIKAKLPLMVGDGVRIESESGVIVVSQEHFHSYKLLKNRTYCQMCKMWISQDTKPHDLTENHARNIFKPVNETFARMIDSISSHCVPCNDVVLADSTQHGHSENHKKIIKDSRVQKSGQTFCEDCSLFIDTLNYNDHINSKKHLNVIVQQNSLTCTEIANVFLCKICNVKVAKNGVRNHVIADKHLVKKARNAIELNDQNGAAKVNDKNTGAAKVNDKNTAPGIKKNNSEYCDICKVKIPIGGKKIHEEGKPHKTQISQLIEIKTNALKNKIENASSSSTSDENKNDIAASSSTIVPYEKLEEYYAQLEYANDLITEVRCKICLVNMPFIERIVIEHMESENHKELANEFKMDVYNKFLCYTDDDKTKVLCEICYVYIPNNERNIIEHMGGRNHEAAKNELLEFHSMEEETDGYVCESCDVHTKDFIKHINSRNHNLRLLKTGEIDKNEMRKHVYVDDVNDLVSRRYRELYKNLLKHNGIYKLSDTSYYCGMCQIKLGRTCEIDHVLGERHLLKLEEVT